MAKECNDKFYYRAQYDLNTHHVVLVFLLASACMHDVCSIRNDEIKCENEIGNCVSR